MRPCLSDLPRNTNRLGTYQHPQPLKSHNGIITQAVSVVFCFPQRRSTVTARNTLPLYSGGEGGGGGAGPPAWPGLCPQRPQALQHRGRGWRGAPPRLETHRPRHPRSQWCALPDCDRACAVRNKARYIPRCRAWGPAPFSARCLHFVGSEPPGPFILVCLLRSNRGTRLQVSPCAQPSRCAMLRQKPYKLAWQQAPTSACLKMKSLGLSKQLVAPGKQWVARWRLSGLHHR